MSKKPTRQCPRCRGHGHVPAETGPRSVGIEVLRDKDDELAQQIKVLQADRADIRQALAKIAAADKADRAAIAATQKKTEALAKSPVKGKKKGPAVSAAPRHPGMEGR